MNRYKQAPRHFARIQGVCGKGVTRSALLALCVASWGIYRACPWPERWRDVLYEGRSW